MQLIKITILNYRKLVKYDDWCSITIHVAMDNNVVTEEISKRSQTICELKFILEYY